MERRNIVGVLLPTLVVVVGILAAVVATVAGSPPEPIVKCKSVNSDCTVTNTYGVFPDRTTCRVAAVAYPADEAELVAVVSTATAKKQHMKVVTEYGHSIPKLSCPAAPLAPGWPSALRS
ncbi:unnamed protein product [Spirodela intermedia]|uniref:Uncharacterized protein n=1 Tax=Spirodela intermedia TaxID=51605 RepID=A0ABN7EAV1_SPIIN|nr:unnamed protein product [Spirodela intermedia]